MKKTAIISVRVDEETKNKLLVESEMQNLTMNTLIGQIITKHVNWDRFAEDMGFIFLTKPFVRAMLSNTPEIEITNIAVTVCRGAMKDATIYMYGEMNLGNFIKTLDLWLAASHIPFRHIKDSERYIIQHEIGEKYSHYIITVVNAVLNDLKYRATKQEITEQSVSFEISKV